MTAKRNWSDASLAILVARIHMRVSKVQVSTMSDDDAGHMPQIERPEAVSNLIREFEGS